MKLFGISITRSEKKVQAFRGYVSNYPFSAYENDDAINLIPFDGEKTPLEMGNPLDIYPDYYAMRTRAWESFLKSEVVQNAIKKYCLWVVGSGLKLQSEPVLSILQKYKTEVTEEQLKRFVQDCEALFRLFAEMKQSVYSQNNNLHDEANELLKNALLAGDMLCVTRFNGKYPTMETIDGRHVQTPFGTAHITEATKRGNVIISGVELDEKGSHVAFYIAQENFSFERIEARMKSGRQQAWLFYAMKYRKSDVRGLSLLSAVMENVAKLDRYKEATVGSAEENAKIPYTIEHNQFSDGSNPMIDQIAQSFGKGKGVAPETISAECEAKATKIAQTTSKQCYNMPIGGQLKRNTNTSDLHFKDFFGVNIDIVYTTLGIPPEVAADKFGGAYSGSRAALKAWEHKIKVDRKNLLYRQYYKPFYDFWMDIMILKQIIQAPGYLTAMAQGEDIIIEAYRASRFIGALVPHIDPVKEINAMRTKLGKALESVPLTSIEQVMEEINSGDFENVINKINNEKEFIKDFLVDDSATNEQPSEESVQSS